MSKTKNKPEKTRKIGSIVVSVILAVAVVLCVIVMIQVLTEGYVSIAGYSLFRVVTGSMEPEIPVGAMLLSKEVRIEALQIDDIVCFFSLESGRFGQIITHRITDILTDESGVLMLETKGDANLVTDLHYVTQDNLIGQVIHYTDRDNLAANILSFLTSGIGFLACLALPALFVAGLIMQECVRNMKNELQMAMDELNRGPVVDPDFPYQYFTREEYEEMYARIRQELMEELGLLPKEPEEPEGMSQEEYEQMCMRIRAELLEELNQSGE